MKTYFVVMSLRGHWNGHPTLGAEFTGRIQAEDPEQLYKMARKEAMAELREQQGSGMSHQSVDNITVEVYSTTEVPS